LNLGGSPGWIASLSQLLVKRMISNCIFVQTHDRLTAEGVIVHESLCIGDKSPKDF